MTLTLTFTAMLNNLVELRQQNYALFSDIQYRNPVTKNLDKGPKMGKVKFCFV